MTQVFEQELDTLKKLILDEGAMVEEAISRSIKALLERDERLANEVIAADEQIDRMEVQIEEECLKILALHQPVANDLRFVVAILKINQDLERMGDLACNIAKRARFLSRREPVVLQIDFPDMAARAQSMVKRSIDALVTRDANLAREVRKADDALDEMRRSADSMLTDKLNQPSDHVESILKALAAVRHLERLGDMATQVAEDVIFLVEGEIIRHNQ